MAPNLFPSPGRINDEEFWDDDEQRSARRYFPDTYLDSPILITERTRWVSALAAPESLSSEDDRQFKNTVDEARKYLKDWTSFQLVEPDMYPDLYRTDWPLEAESSLVDSWTLAHEIFNDVRESMTRKFGTAPTALSSLLSPETIKYFNRWSFWDTLVEQFSKASVMTGDNVIHLKLSHGDSQDITRVVATRDIWFISCPGYGKYMMTYDQVLMLKDVLFTRSQVLTAVTILYEDNQELTQACLDTYEWHESCLYRYGNEGFELLRQSEALSKAYLSYMTDKVFGEDGPYGRMVDKVKRKEESIYKDVFRKDWSATNDLIHLADTFHSVLTKLSDVRHVAEVFGLLKVSGHPLIDPRRGGRSSAEEASKPDQTTYEDAQRLDWEFKRTMLQSYLEKKAGWPPLTFARSARGTKLLECYSTQTRNLHRNSYPLSDWRHCRFGKIVDFDFSPNYLDLVDDKSISFYRSDVAATWNNDITPRSHRRLLIELISRPELNIKEIVRIVATRQVPYDWFIVSLCPKEREFKLDPRMFSMLVFEIRIFFALTEANIADRIFPFLPHQTMTLNREQINARFLEITKPLADPNILRLYEEIDLSRWNLRWRAAAVNPIARTLNDMFGEPGIFDFCHEFFTKAMIVVRVNGCKPPGIDLPNPPSSDLLWYNHLGGFEGICQKLWTIATYSMIALAIADMPLSFILTGQGDNQVLSLQVNREPGKTAYETLSALRDDVVERIRVICESVNQEVKPTECLDSTTIITYSKDIFANGVWLPTSLKSHSRLFPHSSQTFPSVRTNVGTIFSTALAGAEKSDNPLRSYFLSCFYSALYMIRTCQGRGAYGDQMRLIISDLVSKNLYEPRQAKRMFIRFCITLPSELGGFPVIPVLGFLYKGGSDPLSKSLASMSLLGHNSNSRLDNRMLSQLDNDEIFNPDPKLATLFQDPFSVCIRKPPTSVDGVARETIEALSNWDGMKLKDVKELMTQDTNEYIETLVGVLAQCKPMNPLIIRDILDCSISGTINTVSKMFVATRTLQNVVRQMTFPIVEKVLHLEANQLLFMLNRFALLPKSPAKMKRAIDLADELRSRWYPNQENPIVGVSTHQPIDFRFEWGTESFQKEGIIIILSTEDDPMTTRGPNDPYSGGKTFEKRSKHGYQITGTDTNSRALRKLQLISSQTGDDLQFKAIIDAVGLTRSGVLLSDISDLLCGTSGGTLSHRYAARAGGIGAFHIGSPNFATHLLISTDDTGKLSGGKDDFAFMFQEFMLKGQAICQLRHQETKSRYICLNIVTEGADIKPLPDVVVKGPDVVELPVLRLTHNPLVFVRDLNLTRISGLVSHPSVSSQDPLGPSPRLRRQILEAFFREQLRQDSAGRHIADDSSRHFQTRTMDIAEIRSNGLKNILMSIANVALDEAISNHMMTRLAGRRRWRPQVYVSKIIPYMARAVTPALGHPLISSDPIVRAYRLYDEPTYRGGTRTAHDRFVGLIQGYCLRGLEGRLDRYNHRTVGIFSSDNQRVTSECILTCLLTDLYISLKKGEISEATAFRNLGDRFLPAMRALYDEEDKVDTLFTTVLRQSEVYRLTHPVLSSVFSRYDRRRIYSYKGAVADMLKATRQEEWSVPHNIQIRHEVLHPPTRLPPRRAFKLLTIGVHQEGIRRFSKSETDRSDLLLALYWRNKGRTALAAGVAISVWAPFGPLFTNRAVLVVGTGNGAVARVALDSGASVVTGLDLRSATPLKSHRFKFYKPPLVNSSMHASRYNQAPETITTSGNWTDPSVSSRMERYVDESSVVVIDIESGSTRYGLELLLGVMSWKIRPLTALRLFLSEQECRDTISDLMASGAVFRWYDVDNISEVNSRIILFETLPQTLKVTCGYQVESTPSPPCILDIEGDEQSKKIVLSDALFNCLSSFGYASLEESRHALIDMVQQSMGDYNTRFSYESWTRYLRAIKVSEWIETPEEDRLADLLSMYQTGRCTIEISDRRFNIDVDWWFCRHLAGVASRCL